MAHLRLGVLGIRLLPKMRRTGPPERQKIQARYACLFRSYKSRKRKTEGYLSLEECRTLLSVLVGRDHLIVRMFIQLGLRPEELFALRRNDVGKELSGLMMDGFQATAEIRKSRGRRVPIIALTANAMDGERERCLAADMDDYLSKPVRVEELLSKLRRWIGPVPRAQALPAQCGEIGARAINEAERSALELELEHFVAGMGAEGVEREETDSLFSSFLETSAVLMGNLEETLPLRDQEVLANATHALKGSFATFGLKSLANLASQIETAGELGLWAGASEAFSIASSMYSNAREYMIHLGSGRNFSHALNTDGKHKENGSSEEIVGILICRRRGDYGPSPCERPGRDPVRSSVSTSRRRSKWFRVFRSVPSTSAIFAIASQVLTSSVTSSVS